MSGDLPNTGAGRPAQSSLDPHHAPPTQDETPWTQRIDRPRQDEQNKDRHTSQTGCSLDLDEDEKDRDLVDSQSSQSPETPSAVDPGTGSGSGPNATKFELQDQTNLLPMRQLLLVFSGLSMAMACSMLDQTATTTALPTLGKYFNRADIVSWVGTAYLLTSTPLYGRLSDIFGRKPCLLASLAVFFIGALGCSVSQSMIMLIVFRAIEGIGGGGILTCTTIIVSDIVTLQERGKYQGIIGFVIAFSNSVGPIIGGSLTEKATWRACWWLVMPITFIAFIIIYFLLPLKQVTGSYMVKLKQVDWLGSILTLVWVTLALIALSWAGTQYRWDSAAVLAPLLIGVFLGFVFLLVECKAWRLPLIPLYIFRNPTVSASMATTFFSGIAFYGVMYYLPQYFQQVHGASAIRSGVLVLPLSTFQTVCVFIAGYLTSKTGDYWWSMVVGFAVWTVGLGLMSTLGPNSHEGMLIGYQIVIAIGAGLTFQTSLVGIQAAVERKDMATATGTRNFMRMLGGTIGLTSCGTLVNNLAGKELARLGYAQARLDDILKDPVGAQQGVSQDEVDQIRTAFGIQGVFYFLVPCIGLCVFLTFFFVKKIPLKRADDAQRKEEGKAWLKEHKEQKKRKVADVQGTIDGKAAAGSASASVAEGADADLEKGERHVGGSLGSGVSVKPNDGAMAAHETGHDLKDRVEKAAEEGARGVQEAYGAVDLSSRRT